MDTAEPLGPRRTRGRRAANPLRRRHAKAVIIAADSDPVVGNEGSDDASGAEALDAVRKLREKTAATIVLKQGPMGCVVFTGAIPARLEDGIRGLGFPVDVYNTLGAGDAFMAGFLRGWLKDEPMERTCAWANACGALAVSRLLCSPEYPTFDELQYFLDRKDLPRAVRLDRDLAHVHWAETRRPQPDRLMALAIDHRAQFETLADRLGASRDRIGPFKQLAVEATARVAAGRPGYGMLIDGTYGRKALFAAAGHPFWIGRPVELPGSRPLDIEGGGDLGAHLIDWPVTQTVKCLCFYHPDDAGDLKARQERELLRVFDACRTVGRELMIEIIGGKNGAIGDDTVASVLRRLYDIGIKPDWWKLEPQANEGAWRQVDAAIAAGDPKCRGIVLLGLEAPEEDLVRGFVVAAKSRNVRGFAVGRTIFGDAATAWLAGNIDDEMAIADMATRFRRLTEAWEVAVEGDVTPKAIRTAVMPAKAGIQ